MANLKNITELPVAESADGLNLIVNDNGTAKQIAASAVSVQADWAETNESSAAFIKNKPEISGGSCNCMIINMNEDNVDNQVYPNGLYDTIVRMIENNIFDTFIMVGGASAQYNTVVFRPINRIDKDDEGYVIKLASPSDNRMLHVRPDNSGWLEYGE